MLSCSLTTGKPHPRWADGNFRDGDQSERWHSRAAKYSPQTKRGAESEGIDQNTNGRLPSIKTEARTDNNRSPIYDFSPSSTSSIPFSDYQSGVSSPPLLPYNTERRPSFDSDRSHNGSTMVYSSSSTAPTISYHQHPHSSSPYSGSSGYQSEFDDDRVFSHGIAATPSPIPQFCACRTNPAMGHALISLNHQLQSTTNALRQYAQHSHESQCLLFRRIVELNNLMQCVFHGPH